MIGSTFSQRSVERPRVEDATASQPGVETAPNTFVQADQRVEGVQAGEGTTPGRNAEPEAANAKVRSESELSSEEKEEVQRLKTRDAEVRAHEQAHASAGGSYAGSPSYEFETGPDGKRYAVGGEVSIDTSEISGDARASVAKMQQVMRAANAPAQPSSQDRKVAAQARAKIAKLQAEMSQEAARAQAPEDVQEDMSPNRVAEESSARPKNASRAQRSYAATNATPPTSSLDITACAKCGGGH